MRLAGHCRHFFGERESGLSQTAHSPMRSRNQSQINHPTSNLRCVTSQKNKGHHQHRGGSQKSHKESGPSLSISAGIFLNAECPSSVQRIPANIWVFTEQEKFLTHSAFQASYIVSKPRLTVLMSWNIFFLAIC